MISVQVSDHLQLRRAFGTFPSGVALLASMVDGVPTGLVVSSFVSVSLGPPLVSVCIDNDSRTWQVLRRAASFGVSIFADKQASACLELSGRRARKFETVQWRNSRSGDAVWLANAVATLECGIDQTIDAGDHVIVVFRVKSAEYDEDAAPLLFHRSQLHGLRA